MAQAPQLTKVGATIRIEINDGKGYTALVFDFVVTPHGDITTLPDLLASGIKQQLDAFWGARGENKEIVGLKAEVESLKGKLAIVEQVKVEAPPVKKYDPILPDDEKLHVPELKTKRSRKHE